MLQTGSKLQYYDYSIYIHLLPTTHFFSSALVLLNLTGLKKGTTTCCRLQKTPKVIHREPTPFLYKCLRKFILLLTY